MRPPIIMPRELDGLAALRAAELTTMGKTKGERDTEFVKRIVCAYLNAVNEISDYVAHEQSDQRKGKGGAAAILQGSRVQAPPRRG